MSEKGIPIRIASEANSSDAIKKAVIDNQCLAVISIRLVEEEIKSGKIYVIQNKDCDWDRHFSIVYHKNKVITDEMKSLIEIVKNFKQVDVLQGISTGEISVNDQNNVRTDPFVE